MVRVSVVAILLMAGCAPTGDSPSRTASEPATATQHQSAEHSPSAPAVTAAPDACARSALAGMDLAHRVGQLLLVGVPVSDPTSGYTALAPYAVGGVFLAGRSSAGLDTVQAAVNLLQVEGFAATGTFLHVATDQEGGFVQALKGPGFTLIPTAVAQGELPPVELSQLSALWAAELRRAGITLDLAPVADTVPAGTAPSNPPIGVSHRQYGSDPMTVAAAVSAVVAALEGVNVGAVVKHFPGLGRVRANTDTSTQAVDDQTTVDDPLLQPFAAAIQAGASAVMISSASYPQLDPNELAPFSAAVITNLLRGRLGYHGVVVSDDFGHAAAVQDRSPGERAVDFVRAGGDLILTVSGADVAPMTAALIQAAGDPGFAARVDEAALNVLIDKQEAGLLVCT
ncbi:MAG: glycoside hydrolase family 3 protein [Actinomycetota bacterium]|nr:glycoside hydrolase family 3 protein [Actinomycetota bacterium]